MKRRHPFLPALLLLSLLPATWSAQDLLKRPRQIYPRGTLFVSTFGSNAVYAFKASTGEHLATIDPVPNAQSITEGPDGLLYVCAEGINQVLRIHPRRFEIVDAFVFDDPGTPGNETGGLNGPTAATFGPDGHLYVASFNTDSVLKYDGASGTFLGVFVPPGRGNLDGPDAGMTFGPDGNLYVPSFWNDRVLKFRGTNGAWAGPFIDFREGAVNQPRGLVFEKGFWYVASSGNNRILKFDRFGNFVKRFANTGTPYSLAFHPDTEDLYVVNVDVSNVRRFDGETGALVGKLVERSRRHDAGDVRPLLRALSARHDGRQAASGPSSRSPATASARMRAARSTSPSVVKRPSERRRLPSIRSRGRPSAAST